MADESGATQESTTEQGEYSDDVRTVHNGGREFIVVGTAHVSRESSELVRKVIAGEHPDRVCVELDERRYLALIEGEHWENLDLRAVIRRKQIAILLVNVVLSSFQKRLGGQVGVLPGTELLAAVQEAQKLGIPVSFCDREVRVTLGRAWRLTPFLRKFMLLGLLLESLFDRTEVSEDVLRDLRRGDVLSEMLKELGEMMPILKSVLIDERDAYLTEKVLQQPESRILLVVGAGHADGITRALRIGKRTELAPLDRIPPAGLTSTVVAWSIPVVILAAIALVAWRKGMAVAGHSALYWILATGTPCSIGAILAMAHPLTVVCAFLAAPLSTLSPVIGAGYITALVEVYLRPPLVHNFRNVANDVYKWRGWWRNGLLRLFLVFLLPSIGAMIGMWIGTYGIASNLF